MDVRTPCDLGPATCAKGDCKSNSCSGSESSSTEEEERLRRLFQTCDRDGDGFIDSQDLAVICQQLNMEDAVDEIMQQLGADMEGRISFDEFVNCRMRLVSEIEQEKLRERGVGIDVPERRINAATASTMSWGSPAHDNILGIRSTADACALEVEQHNLYKLMESHDPEALQHMIETADTMQGEQGGSNFLDVANSLHLAALTSLKGEIIDLSNRLQHVTAEKEVLEKQLSKQQVEKLRIQRELEDRLEQTTLRYEERITELHSVIAELRKKIERHQINVIREEDEYEESDGNQSNKSNDEVSVNENNANGSQAASIGDIGADLNAELSRVVTELENAIGEHHKMTACSDASLLDRKLAQERPHLDSKALQSCEEELESLALAASEPPTYPSDITQFEEEILSLRNDNSELHQQLGRQETELNKLKAQLGGIREERDRLKRRVRELQTRLQSLEAATTIPTATSPLNSRTSTPTKTPGINPATGERTLSVSSSDQTPVAKMAGLKKLKTTAPGSDRHVLGSEISSYGLPNAKVAEHLVQNMQECSSVQEISQTLYQSGNEVSENKIREFEIEFERLTSKIDHLKSQNDLLTLTLEESKGHCDRLTVLMGKYESNNTALQLAMNYSEQVLEAYEVLVNLLESEKGMLLANCRAAGLGSMAAGGGGDRESMEVQDQEEVTQILQKAHLARKAAEHMAKTLLQRFERPLGGSVPQCTASPWEDLSSNSRTASTTSSTASSADMEFSKMDEQKLRELIATLKHDRAAVRTTVLELESVHIDPFMSESVPNPDAQRLDLENAVLMQELMAMKEDKAELKAHSYLLEKEKSSLELQLSSKQSQEQAYLVQIDHLKSEVKELAARLGKHTKRQGSRSHSGDDDSSECSSTTPSITLAELRSHDVSEVAKDLHDSLRREKKLKARVQELVATLEKLSRNSEIRHQQSAEFVNDLKRANSALVTAFEKAKKKYQGKMKKMEMQMSAMQERYENQLRILKQRLLSQEDEPRSLPANETSL